MGTQSSDSASIQAKLYEFNKVCNIDAQGNIQSNDPSCHIVPALDGIVSGTPGSGSENFTFALRHYFEQTKDIMMLNDFRNSTTYLTDVMGSETQRITRLKAKTIDQVHKIRQSYLMKKYRIAYNIFVANIIQFTLFVVIVFAVMFTMRVTYPSLVGTTLALSVSLTVLAIYLLILMVVIKNHQTRRKDDWNKFYYPSMASEKTTCPGIKHVPATKPATTTATSSSANS